MLASTIHLLLMLLVTAWMANGKPAEPSESVSGRESRQLIMLPYHVPWSEPPRQSGFQHVHDYYGSLINTAHPVTQQRLMEAWLTAAALNKGSKPSLIDESGLDSKNRNRSMNAPSRFSSKNQEQDHSLNTFLDVSQHEFQQVEARPDVQSFVNQTIQFIVQVVVQAVLSQLSG